MKTITKLRLCAAVSAAALSVSSVALAQEDSLVDYGYAMDSEGKAIIQGGTGGCVHTPFPPGDIALVEQCDPELIQPKMTMVEVSEAVQSEALFAFDSAELKPTAQERLSQLAATVQGMDRIDEISVVGHTDSTGPAEYNMVLSERRANSVKEFLVGLGADPGRITATGVGEEQPIASNDTREGRAENRRVDVTVKGAKEEEQPAS